MTLTKAQQEMVEANMGLVGKVLKDKVDAASGHGIYSNEDLYQIGCIGLCKAAATFQGGAFSPYAYKVIWNTVCNALIYANRRNVTELLTEDGEIKFDSNTLTREEPVFSTLKLDLEVAMERARAKASQSVQKGIDALELLAAGYTSTEISERMGSAPNQVRVMMSRARKYLQGIPELCYLNYGEN